MTGRPLVLFVTLALGLLVAPLAADAQPPAHVHRIGVLTGTTREQDRNVKAFLEGLRDLGYVGGQHLVLEVRFSHMVKFAGNADERSPRRHARFPSAIGWNVGMKPAGRLLRPSPGRQLWRWHRICSEDRCSRVPPRRR
jgi:hypothetical protein